MISAKWYKIFSDSKTVSKGKCTVGVMFKV